MKAMVLNELGEIKSNPTPLSLQQVSEPTPGEDEVLIKVSACGVCHTELDEIEGRTPPPELPVILGHQVVGTVEQVGQVLQVKKGDRVGMAWIFSACGHCEHGLLLWFA